MQSEQERHDEAQELAVLVVASGFATGISLLMGAQGYAPAAGWTAFAAAMLWLLALLQCDSIHIDRGPGA